MTKRLKIGQVVKEKNVFKEACLMHLLKNNLMTLIVMHLRHVVLFDTTHLYNSVGK